MKLKFCSPSMSEELTPRTLPSSSTVGPPDIPPLRSAFTPVIGMPLLLVWWLDTVPDLKSARTWLESTTSATAAGNPIAVTAVLLAGSAVATGSAGVLSASILSRATSPWSVPRKSSTWAMVARSSTAPSTVCGCRAYTVSFGGDPPSDPSTSQFATARGYIPAASSVVEVAGADLLHEELGDEVLATSGRLDAVPGRHGVTGRRHEEARAHRDGLERSLPAVPEVDVALPLLGQLDDALLDVGDGVGGRPAGRGLSCGNRGSDHLPGRGEEQQHHRSPGDEQATGPHGQSSQVKKFVR